jgi:hypothetical protein
VKKDDERKKKYVTAEPQVREKELSLFNKKQFSSSGY